MFAFITLLVTNSYLDTYAFLQKGSWNQPIQWIRALIVYQPYKTEGVVRLPACVVALHA